ncbi:Major facilitator superfamily protein [Abeliophyllum distichum]|uniref:Major facilitator superfamily protein n=1 Tax=Abeliophyllum distichum TaxID=126358 RepID=A0ABD1SVV9_9LAMI
MAALKAELHHFSSPLARKEDVVLKTQTPHPLRHLYWPEELLALVASAALVHLESQIQTKTSDFHTRIMDFFDIIASMGIGAFLTAILVIDNGADRPLFSTKDSEGEQADESLLPGVYKEVGPALHTDPTGLGSLTLFRSIVQSSCYPLAAYLTVRHNRTQIIALGAFLWAVATFLVAISSTFTEVAMSRGLNGIILAIVKPAIQSLIADSTNESNRGTAFGWLHLTGNLCSIIGELISILIASTSFMGIPSWRISFHLVGLLSVVIGILVHPFANDPCFLDPNNIGKDRATLKLFLPETNDLIKEAKAVMKVPSFHILVAQGVSGSFPWSTLSFVPMWLELIGFSRKTTAIIWTMFNVAGSIG